MAAQSSTVRPMSLLGSLATLLPLGVTVCVVRLAGLDWHDATLYGALIYLVYRYVIVRRIVLRDHRQGIVALRAGRFEDGLEAFRRSEAAFEKRRTLDRFRAVLLGSGGAFTFRILARYNQAYALSRLGRGEETMELLDSILKEQPDMSMAKELRDVLLAGSRLHPEVGEAMGEVQD